MNGYNRVISLPVTCPCCGKTFDVPVTVRDGDELTIKAMHAECQFCGCAANVHVSIGMRSYLATEVAR